MKKVLAFSGSLSDASINHKLVEYTHSQIEDLDVNVIRLSSYEAPLYAMEREKNGGIPKPIQELRKLFDEVDGFMISTPEYNGSVPAGFKNTIDWISRMEGKIFQDKPVLLMATSPGGRGGKSVLDHLSAAIPFWGANLIGPFSLPKFNENFSGSMPSEPFHSELKSLINEFEQAVLSS